MNTQMNTQVSTQVNTLDERALLLLLTDAVGAGFGTEDFCLFLYSLVRMQAPKTIVELGTGFGLTTFWMALAAKSNKAGHVWTVDSFDFFDEEPAAVQRVLERLRESNVISLDNSTAEEYYSRISTLFGLDPYLTFVKSKIELNEVGHFTDYPFVDKPIELLFADFAHDGRSTLLLLGHFLPRMASSSSIFIHSASTNWPSYLLLEQLASQLNAGKVPKLLQDFCSFDLGEFVRHHRIVLVHLTECKPRQYQNSAAWLKIEPIDLLPHPQTNVRGIEGPLTARGDG
jgi:hypothetical protein